LCTSTDRPDAGKIHAIPVYERRFEDADGQKYATDEPAVGIFRFDKDCKGVMLHQLRE
jgi:hypothetical protein